MQKPVKTATLDAMRYWASNVKVSNLYFPQCSGMIEGSPHQRQLLTYDIFPVQSPVYRSKMFFDDCKAAFAAGVIPNPGEPVTILLRDESTLSCDYNSLLDLSTPCPAEWLGEDGSCFKIHHDTVTNEEASRLCNEQGAELIAVSSEDIDNKVITLLTSYQKYRQTPTYPGYYHIGTYLRKNAYQYYHRSGTRV